MSRVYGYCRVSKEEQARDGLSLPDQRQAIERYCAEEGLGQPEILEEPGVSGFSNPLRRREAGARLLEAMAHNGCIHVCVTMLDRLSRVTSDIVMVAEMARERGFILHILRDPLLGRLDTSTAVGEFFLTVIAALGRMESRRTGERIRHVLAYKREQAGGDGRINGAPPFGFRWRYGRGRPAPEGKANYLVPDEAEQAALQHVRALRSEGLSYDAIAAQLNETGQCRPRRGGLWHVTQVRRILAGAVRTG